MFFRPVALCIQNGRDFAHFCEQEAMRETLGEPEPSTVPFPVLPQADFAPGQEPAEPVSDTLRPVADAPFGAKHEFVHVPTRLPVHSA